MGVLDRAQFLATLSQSIARPDGVNPREYAVILLDCDDFTIVNDSLGYRVGDELLAELGRRIEGVLAGSGRLGYLGSDEFGILLDTFSSLRYATTIAERIIQDLHTPIIIGAHQLFVSVSQGITTSDLGYDDVNALLRDADSALHHAKANGRSTYSVFSHALRAQAIRRLDLATSLRLAVAREEFQVYYQPIINLATSTLEGFEAVLRWAHPSDGLLAPGEFLTVALEFGLISQLDRWVLASACRQIQSWRCSDPGAAQLEVSVNMSGRLLSEPDLVRFIAQTLEATALPPEALNLEVTEETVITQGDAALLALHQLRALGVRVSLDDFGTRYSSLSYLHQLPITTLKLDRSFLNGAEARQRSAHVIDAVIGLAHTLGLRVVGEGIEQEQHLTLLRSLGCDLGQGYYFARPLPAAEAESIVAQYQGAPRGSPVPPPPPAYPAERWTPNDALTGLLGRGGFAVALEQMIRRHDQPGRSFALAMMDVDFFKSVNDAFGHARGDQVLIELAQRVRGAVRSDDVVFRYGGDELVLLLPGCDRSQAGTLATRIVEAVAARPFAGEPPVALTSSVGVAVYPDDATTAEALFELADQRNYQAKRGGRGRAIWDVQSQPTRPSVEGPSRLIERDQTLESCHQFLDAWPSEGRGILKIVAAPKVGASRFLAEVEQAARLRGQAVLYLRGTAALRERAYGMFLDLRERWPDLPLPSSGPATFARALAREVLPRPDSPLLLIVDHLGRADLASVELLEALFGTPELRHMAIAYATTRASLSLELPRQPMLHVTLALEPLSLMGLRTWVRHSLNWEAPQELLLWLHNQTNGQPGKIRAALAYLLSHKILHHSAGTWHVWADYQAYPLSANLDQQAARAAQALPASPNLLIGRESEIPRLKQLVRQHRLVQLSGPGGVGKSHLALQTAAELQEAFSDGICYVPLGALDRPDFLAYAIAESLGLSLVGGRPPAEQLTTHLGSKQLLLLLDNAPPGGLDQELLEEITRRAPQVHVLLTARNQLNLPRLAVFPIESLSYPESDEAWQIEQHAAVQLFVTLARKHLPGFALSNEQRGPVARICRLVGGLPLGLELAAAWVRVLHCGDIARQISENLTALSLANADRPQQERSMLAMVDSLWSLLSEHERGLLRRLAVFRGGFTPEAAHEVVGASLFFLEALAAKGYLRWTRRQRFEAHELLRQYAASRLREQPAEQREALASHARFFLRPLRRPELLQDGSQQVVNSLNADMENLRAAWQWGLDERALETIGEHLEGLETFYDLRGSFHEAEAIFTTALHRIVPTEPYPNLSEAERMVAGRLGAARARFLLRLSLYDEARRAVEEARTLRADAGDHALEAVSHYHVGTACWRQGEYATAQAHFEQARALARAVGLRSLEADCLRRLSRVTCDLGQYAEARRYGEQSLELCRAAGERQREARMLNDLGIIADSQGDYRASREAYEQCLRIYRLIGDLPGEAQALHNLGAGAADQGAYAESEIYLEKALGIFRTIGLLHDEAIVIENLGDSARLQGDLIKAETCYQQALLICREIGDRQGETYLLANLGLLAHQQGANSEAYDSCREALEVARAIHDRRAEANALLFLGHAMSARGDLTPAVAAYGEATTILCDLGQDRLAAEPRASLALATLAQGHAEEAGRLIDALLPQLGDEPLEGASEPLRAFLAAFEVLAAIGDPRAEDLLTRATALLHTRAAAIIGEERRRQFLENLPVHRSLIAAGVLAAGQNLPVQRGSVATDAVTSTG